MRYAYYDHTVNMLLSLQQFADQALGPNGDMIHQAIMANNPLFFQILKDKLHLSLEHPIKISAAMIIENLPEEENFSMLPKINAFFDRHSIQQEGGNLLLTGHELIELLGREHLLQSPEQIAANVPAVDNGSVSHHAKEEGESTYNNKGVVQALVSRRVQDGLHQPLEGASTNPQVTLLTP